MQEMMYDINSFLIAGVLLLSMVAAIEAGYRVGRGTYRVAITDLDRPRRGAIEVSQKSLADLQTAVLCSIVPADAAQR